MARPTGTRPSTSSRRWVADQTVVSVGPYMLWIAPDRPARSWRARGTGNGSPPTRRWLSPPRAASPSVSAASIATSDGVHCRWVTACRRSSSGSVSTGWAARAVAVSLARRTSSSFSRLARTRSGSTPKSIRQPISSQPTALRRSTKPRQRSGVPKKALDLEVALETVVEEHLHIRRGELGEILLAQAAGQVGEQVHRGPEIAAERLAHGLPHLLEVIADEGVEHERDVPLPGMPGLRARPPGRSRSWRPGPRRSARAGG